MLGPAVPAHATQMPALQRGLVPLQATELPQTPLELQVCKPLVPPVSHCVRPGLQATHTALRHAGVVPLHVLTGVTETKSAPQVSTVWLLQTVSPGFLPEHSATTFWHDPAVPPERVSQNCPELQSPFAIQVPLLQSTLCALAVDEQP